MAKKKNIKELKTAPITDSSDVVYLTPENAAFYETEGKLLGLKLNGEDVGRVQLYRMFPFTNPDDYLSVRGDEMVEYGVIALTNVFDQTTRGLFAEDLKRRYFAPDILEVYDIKEEFGFLYIDANTTAGKRSFTVFDLNNNLQSLGANACMITDVDGARYKFPNVSGLSTKVLRYLEIWL